MSKVKFTEEQIREIADGLTAGFVYYANPETGEVEQMTSDESLENYGISWDEEDEEEEDPDEPQWQKDLRADVKAQMEKINSWPRFIRIEKPESHESYEIMESFVEEVIPEGSLKESFWRALDKRSPFANFNAIVHNCEYKEDWFAFRLKKLMEWVKLELGEYNE